MPLKAGRNILCLRMNCNGNRHDSALSSYWRGLRRSPIPNRLPWIELSKMLERQMSRGVRQSTLGSGRFPRTTVTTPAKSPCLGDRLAPGLLKVAATPGRVLVRSFPDKITSHERRPYAPLHISYYFRPRFHPGGVVFSFRRHSGRLTSLCAGDPCGVAISDCFRGARSVCGGGALPPSEAARCSGIDSEWSNRDHVLQPGIELR